MTPEYLTVAELRRRVKNANLRLPSTSRARNDILSFCKENGLITHIESLAARTVYDTRRNILTDALHRRGCELRDDSRLCDAYLTYGEGDVEEIADIMAEMKFYFAETQYESIMDDLHEEAYRQYSRERDDYYTRFGDYWCADEASEEAKAKALRLWVATKGARAAAEHASLPMTLRYRLVRQCRESELSTLRGNLDHVSWGEMTSRIGDWLDRPSVPQPGELEEQVIQDALAEVRANMERRCLRERLKTRLCELARGDSQGGALKVAVASNVEKIRQLLYDGLDRHLRTHNNDVEATAQYIAHKLEFNHALESAKSLNEWMLNSSYPEMISLPVMDTIARKLDRSSWPKQRLSHYELDLAFAVLVARTHKTGGSQVMSFDKNARRKHKSKNNTWRCAENDGGCRFEGRLQQLWDHACSKHGKRSADNLNVVRLGSAVASDKPLAARYTMAAVLIQRAYRHHRYCPDHPKCQQFMSEAATKWGMMP